MTQDGQSTANHFYFWVDYTMVRSTEAKISQANPWPISNFTIQWFATRKKKCLLIIILANHFFYIWVDYTKVRSAKAKILGQSMANI